MKRSVFPIDAKLVAAKVAAAIVSLFVFGATTVWAQSTELQEGSPTRHPETGIAILDCAPAVPAPEDSCVVRIPPRQLRGTLRAAPIGEKTGKFEFVRPGHQLFPKDLTLSETIVLIDLSPGPTVDRTKAPIKTEQKLIREFVKSLPVGERIAIYGFDGKMHRLVDFTTDRSVALNAIDTLKFSGVNSRITTFSKEAISILAGRDRAVLKNLFVISDGEEEGLFNAGEVTSAAIKANVSVSTLGMFWRNSGNRVTATAMDNLSKLTNGTLGASVELNLKRPADANRALTEFQSVLNSSMSSSGLILAVGTPYEADITVPMQVPVSGVAGSYQSQDISVRFIPVKAEDPAEENDSEAKADGKASAKDDGKMLFGYPKMWVYLAAAGVVALLLLLLLLLLVRRKKPVEELSEDDGLDFDDSEMEGSEATQMSPSSARLATAHAFLINTVTRQRSPLTGERTSVGRGSTNMLIIDDVSVSRMHSEIIRNRSGGYSVSDLDSLNGTHINGKKIAGVGQVNPGDEIKFGEVTMRFVLA